MSRGENITSGSHRSISFGTQPALVLRTGPVDTVAMALVATSGTSTTVAPPVTPSPSVTAPVESTVDISEELLTHVRSVRNGYSGGSVLAPQVEPPLVFAQVEDGTEGLVPHIGGFNGKVGTEVPPTPTDILLSSRRGCRLRLSSSTGTGKWPTGWFTVPPPGIDGTERVPTDSLSSVHVQGSGRCPKTQTTSPTSSVTTPELSESGGSCCSTRDTIDTGRTVPETPGTRSGFCGRSTYDGGTTGSKTQYTYIKPRWRSPPHV